MSQFSEDHKLDLTGQRCVYCGAPATDLDHVPPISLIKRWRLAMQPEVVPACRFCNRELGSRVVLFTKRARQQWIKTVLWKKAVPRTGKLFVPPKVA